MALIRPASTKSDIEETIIALTGVKKTLGLKSLEELFLLKSDISSIVEQNKQWTVFTITVSLLIFALPMYLSAIKEMIIGIIMKFKLLLTFQSGGNVLLSASNVIVPDEEVELFGSVVIALVALVVVVLITMSLQRRVKNTKNLCLLEKIINQIIAEREIWNSVHSQAISEYQKYLKEKRIITKT